nr:MAG TPA: hypothetical protein [Caudoviricetes sp.]
MVGREVGNVVMCSPVLIIAGLMFVWLVMLLTGWFYDNR